MQNRILKAGALAVLLLSAAATHAQSSINLRETVTVDVVRKARSAIAYISTEKTVYGWAVDNPFRPTAGDIVAAPQSSLGSGFVIHPDGYLVTNSHVVDQAQIISVSLDDGQKYPARVIAADSAADLAVLKIEVGRALPFLPLGDSANLLIGEPVIAVGSPLGFAHSVSTGVVSAEHRDLRDANGNLQLGDLIQTDAAINRGNSGAPLRTYDQIGST